MNDNDKVESKTATNSLQLYDNNINSINLFSEEGIAKAMVILNRLVKTPKSGVKDINDGIAMMMKAQELQMPLSTCIEHIHIINGKTGVDIHIIKALLLRAGITWETTEDYIPLYEYTDGFNVYNEWELPTYCVKCKDAVSAEKVSDKEDDQIGVYPVQYYMDSANAVYKSYQLTDQFQICASAKQMAHAATQNKRGVMRIPAIATNRRATYVFTRYITTPMGVKEVKATSSYSYIEGVAAGHFEKDTYKKYPNVMIKTRAFVYGARDIASDILFGSMETNELKIVNNMDGDERDIIDISVDNID